MRTPPRILAVDDVPANLEILRVRLEAEGYEVVTAADGEEALEQTRKLTPDLVLLDVLMPKLDGIAVLKQLKQETAERFVPVILVTAKADTRDIVQGLEAGGDDYLTKPFEQAALVARVRSLLRVKELHDTIQQQATKLEQQSEQLANWNHLLEERVAQQMTEIERIGQLERFLAPHVARMIASSDAPGYGLGQSSQGGHGRVLRFARLYCIHRQIRARRGHGRPPRISRKRRRAYFSLMRVRWIVSSVTES